MSRRILFSPVGGTDPISANNGRDGSLLHICREYRPEIIYLYMSHETLEFQKKDDRYRFCLNKLGELQNRSMDIRIIERDDLTEVQEYDFFYEDFRGLLKSITSQMSEDDELLLNVSSGTPAMKSGLLVLKHLGEFDCRAIQVSTPARSMNDHSHRDYNVQDLWDLDDDNAEEHENRCAEIHCPTLSMLKQLEIIKQLIREYDYAAALTAAKMLPEAENRNYISMLLMAADRLKLNLRKWSKEKNACGKQVFPIQSGDEMAMFEYALALDIKRKKEEFGDFVRALSPIILKLFELVLRRKYGIDIRQYTRKTDKGTKWDEYALRGSELEKPLLEAFSDFRYGSHVYSSHLVALIRYFAKKDIPLVELFDGLRYVEEKVRNIAAHEIVSVTDEMIKNQTEGSGAETIMEMIKKAFVYAGFNIRKEDWDAYDRMNELIISKFE